MGDTPQEDTTVTVRVEEDSHYGTLDEDLTPVGTLQCTVTMGPGVLLGRVGSVPPRVRRVLLIRSV